MNDPRLLRTLESGSARNQHSRDGGTVAAAVRDTLALLVVGLVVAYVVAVVPPELLGLLVGVPAVLGLATLVLLALTVHAPVGRTLPVARDARPSLARSGRLGKALVVAGLAAVAWALLADPVVGLAAALGGALVVVVR